MEISIIQYLIVCPLVFLAGFVDAVAGGGGLISLPAYLIAGFPVHFAIGTNKVSSAMGTTLTTVRYTKSGFIPWKQAIFCVLFALAGSACGANLALLIDDGVFKIIMLVILPLTALYVMKGKALSGEREPYSKLKTMLLSCVIAFVIGAYDGFTVRARNIPHPAADGRCAHARYRGKRRQQGYKPRNEHLGACSFPHKRQGNFRSRARRRTVFHCRQLARLKLFSKKAAARP